MLQIGLAYHILLTSGVGFPPTLLRDGSSSQATCQF